MGQEDDQSLRVDVGRVESGETFVRVVHVPTGKTAIRVGLGHANTRDVIDQLVRELMALVEADPARP